MQDTTKANLGRPAKLEIPMTDRQRAAAYRRKRYEDASMAHENLEAASTAVLLAVLAVLARQLTNASEGTPDEVDTAREIAGRIIRQLCDRHEIVIP
jgi:hypothetical protein